MSLFAIIFTLVFTIVNKAELSDFEIGFMILFTIFTFIVEMSFYGIQRKIK